MRVRRWSQPAGRPQVPEVVPGDDAHNETEDVDVSDERTPRVASWLVAVIEEEKRRECMLDDGTKKAPLLPFFCSVVFSFAENLSNGLQLIFVSNQ